MLYSTTWDFNQSLLDFFNLVDMQLILMLMCESLHLIISRLHCSAVKLKAIIKRNEVESLLPCRLQFDCVACMMCQCAVLLKTKLSPVTCLLAVNVCWDSVVTNLTDSVHWLSVLAEKSPTTDRVPDIMAYMVNADCMHIRWLDALCSVLVMYGTYNWSFYELKDSLTMTRWSFWCVLCIC